MDASWLASWLADWHWTTQGEPDTRHVPHAQRQEYLREFARLSDTPTDAIYRDVSTEDDTMAFMISDTSSERDFGPPAPEGTHLAICYMLVDMGIQSSPLYGDKHQVYVAWELCDEQREDGKQYTIGKFYTLSLNEKATLRHHLEAWRGRAFTKEELKGFDLGSICGKPCMVTIQHGENDQGRKYAKVAAVAAVPKRLASTVPELHADPLVFTLQTRECEELLPQWLQAKINFSQPTQKPKPAPAKKPEPVAAGADDDMNDDIPF